jgi:hypothetical protein
MGRRALLWSIWLGFILYVLLWAPPLQAATLQTSDFVVQILNPVVVSLFSLIGIWLLVYSCLVFIDGRMQPLPAWAFILASAGMGVVALIPYLALREPNQQFSGTKDAWLQWLDSKPMAWILTISTLGLLAFAVFLGDWGAFAQAFQTNRFIHAMSLAFCLLALLFPVPTLLSDDMARRGLTSNSQLFWWVAVIPLFGPLAYLCLRPSLGRR